MTFVAGFLGMKDGYVLARCMEICKNLRIKTIYYEHHENIQEDLDVLFVFRYRKIIPKEVLYRPALGCIMTHYSKLPKYRGFYPINQAVRNGETEIGITMFYGDDGVDTGDILCQRVVKIEINDTIAQIYEMCDDCAIDMFCNVIFQILQGNEPRTKQPTVDNIHIYSSKELPAEINGLDIGSFSVEQLHNYIRSLTGAGQEAAYIEDDTHRLYFEKTWLVCRAQSQGWFKR
jgi:methionyl-tRNA formyltransferase